MFYKNGGGLTSEICLAEKGEGYSSYYNELKFLEVHVYMYVCKFYITLMNQQCDVCQHSKEFTIT